MILSLADEKGVKTNLKASTKEDTLMSLLKGKDAKESVVIEQKESLELNPKITQSMTIKENEKLLSQMRKII